MYHTILVPLDGTARSEAILPHVESLARAHEARVVLLRVEEPTPVYVRLPGSDSLMVNDLHAPPSDRAAVYLAGKRGELSRKGLQASTVIESGPVVETVLRVAAQCDADLIALASHGRTALEQLAVRSVAAGVLHGARCPVLLVRATD